VTRSVSLLLALAAVAALPAVPTPAQAAPAARKCPSLTVNAPAGYSVRVIRLRTHITSCRAARGLVRAAYKTAPGGYAPWTVRGYKCRARADDSVVCTSGEAIVRWLQRVSF
jgi:hypothetical protein